MKKAIVFCLFLCLLLTGCAAPGTAGTDTPQMKETHVPVVLCRPASQELEFMVEGMSELCPMTLFEGDGYSIYIPDEGWELEQVKGDAFLGDDFREDQWISTFNENVRLRVCFYPGVTENDIKTAISPAPIVPTDNGYWLMESRDPSDCEIIRLYPAESGVYMVKMEYPAEAAEGFGVRLPVIADTFEIG